MPAESPRGVGWPKVQTTAHKKVKKVKKVNFPCAHKFTDYPFTIERETALILARGEKDVGL